MHPITLRVLAGLLAIGAGWVLFFKDASNMSYQVKICCFVFMVYTGQHALFGEAIERAIAKFLGFKAKSEHIDKATVASQSTEE